MPKPPAPAPPPAASGDTPSRDDLTQAWGDKVKDQVSRKALVRFAGGRFVAAENGMASYGLPNQHHLSRCEEVRPEVEQALSDHFGQAIRIQLVIDDGPTLANPDPVEDETVDIDALEDATAPVASPEERLKQAFPGAEEVTP